MLTRQLKTHHVLKLLDFLLLQLENYVPSLALRVTRNLKLSSSYQSNINYALLRLLHRFIKFLELSKVDQSLECLHLGGVVWGFKIRRVCVSFH
jgi:hypothetical protein